MSLRGGLGDEFVVEDLDAEGCGEECNKDDE